MNAVEFVPVAVVIMVAIAMAGQHRRLRPAVSARLLTFGMLVAIVTLVPSLFVLALAFIAHPPGLGIGLDWCHEVLGIHPEVNARISGVALVWLAAGLVRARRVGRSWRSLRLNEPGALDVVDDDRPYAYAVPGGGRRIAVSTGLVSALDPDEFAVVIAHERAHSTYRHDLHLLVADLAVAFVPMFVPVRRRLRYELERWADEAAVDAAAGDRRRVAHTLARVALDAADRPSAAAGFGRLGVADRVEALLRPPVFRLQSVWRIIMLSSVTLAVAAASMQAMHLGQLLNTLCPG